MQGIIYFHFLSYTSQLGAIMCSYYAFVAKLIVITGTQRTSMFSPLRCLLSSVLCYAMLPAAKHSASLPKLKAIMRR
jgi:hypothetical protein